MKGVGSRNKLTPWHAHLYPSHALLDQLGRAVCGARCLPRKELHEAWEMAQLVRGAFSRKDSGGVSAGGRVVDLCCGYGLLAQVLLLVGDEEGGASGEEAVAVDVRLPPNHGRVRDAVAGAFPRLRGRVTFVQAPLSSVELRASDLVVSSHACGSLTDDVLGRAADVGARVAVMPCCHAFRFRDDLAEHADPAAAIDDERVRALQGRGYRAWSASISAAVSAKHRLVFGAPQ